MTIESHGSVATATFDGRTGRIASRTDINGQKSSYCYDAAGRLSARIAPYEQPSDSNKNPCDADIRSNATIRFDYQPRAAGYAYAVAEHRDATRPGDPIRTIAFADGTGRRTQTKQDATVFVASGQAPQDAMTVSGATEQDALGHIVKRWYPMKDDTLPAQFNPARASAPPTETTHDLADRVTRIVHPDLTQTTFDYAFGGAADFGDDVLQLTTTDGNGKTKRTYSDAHDRLLAADEMPAGAPRRRTRYSYDALGSVSATIEPAGATSTHGYDLLGRRTSTNTADGGLVEMRFDAASNLVAKITPNLRAKGQEIRYAYDTERLEKIDYPDATPDVEYTWGEAADRAINGDARIIGVKDAARVATLEYDKLGNVAKQRSTPTARGPGLTTGGPTETTFTYDAMSRLIDLRYPDGEVLHHGYDAGGRPASIVGQHGSTTRRYLDRLQYDEFGQRRLQATANGVQTLYTYDPMRRSTRQLTTIGATELQDLVHTYDNVGNVLAADNQLPARVASPRGGGPGKHTFTYDPYYRIASATGTYASASDRRRDYTFSNAYDLAGNVTSKVQTDTTTKLPAGGKQTEAPTTYTSSFTYNATRPHQVAASGQRAFTYDLDGNLTGWKDKQKQGRAMTWDATDHMTTLTNSGDGSRSQYRYDDSGRLAFQAGGGDQIEFVNPWFEIQNGTGLLKHVLVGGQRIATQRVVSAPEFYYPQTNLQGSITLVTDAAGATAENVEYFPAGEVWAREKDDGARPVRRAFAGGHLDQLRGVTNLGARWYEPRDQLFLAPDPLLVERPSASLTDPALLTPYTYAESNPLRFVDVGGRNPDDAQNASNDASVEGVSAPLPVSVDPPEAANAEVGQQRNAALAAAQGGVGGDAPVPAIVPPAGNRWSLPGLERIRKAENVFEKIETRPLVDIWFGGEDGPGLHVKLTPGFGAHEFSVFGKTAAPPEAVAAVSSGGDPPPAGFGAGGKSTMSKHVTFSQHVRFAKGTKSK